VEGAIGGELTLLPSGGRRVVRRGELVHQQRQVALGVGAGQEPYRLQYLVVARRRLPEREAAVADRAERGEREGARLVLLCRGVTALRHQPVDRGRAEVVGQQRRITGGCGQGRE
jgi:hypothetical protein